MSAAIWTYDVTHSAFARGLSRYGRDSEDDQFPTSRLVVPYGAGAAVIDHRAAGSGVSPR
jgi:hypothetical protein